MTETERSAHSGALDERAKVVKWLRAQQAFHETTYQHARKYGDEHSMDRCAARARSYGNAACAIQAEHHL